MPVSKTNEISLIKILKKDKEKLESLSILNANDRKRLGNVIIEQIRERTRGGIGVDAKGQEYNLASKPYTEDYANKKGVAKNAVDLTLSGDMLENIFVKSTEEKSVTISVRNRDYGKLRGAEEGIMRKVGGLVKRPFFHLSQNDIDEIRNNKDFIAVFKRALKRNED